MESLQELFTLAMPVLVILGRILMIVVPLLVAVAYLTLMERKVIAGMQLRRGPNVVGPFGLLQPLADGLKLFLKEVIIPTSASKAVFILAPMLTFMLAMLGWAVIPIHAGFVLANINVGILYLFAVSSLGVYGIIMAGWASNSKYAFLGAIRSAAQMVSYEVSIGLVIVTVLLVVGSLNMTDIILAQKTHGWFAFTGLFPMFIVFFISALAETNRHPFDLPEAEAELVSGYNVEYSSMTFALFLGGWLPPMDTPWLNIVPGALWFAMKVTFLLYVFIWARATLPRYRYDQLMRLGWKVFLPISLLWVVLTAGYLEYYNLLPHQG
jgi:NADH-quinone oxidoreductase subunit H